MRFYLKCFQEMRFHPKWNSRIIECISLISYALMVNEEPNSSNWPTHGIRQGHPLSPCIFSLCMEVLNHTLSIEANNNRSGLGVKICPRDIMIPGLFFADDCLLFYNANSTSCCDLEPSWIFFGYTSGQRINFHKSVLTFSRNAFVTHK